MMVIIKDSFELDLYEFHAGDSYDYVSSYVKHIETSEGVYNPVINHVIRYEYKKDEFIEIPITSDVCTLVDNSEPDDLEEVVSVAEHISFDSAIKSVKSVTDRNLLELSQLLSDLVRIRDEAIKEDIKEKKLFSFPVQEVEEVINDIYRFTKKKIRDETTFIKPRLSEDLFMFNKAKYLE
jgi:hypothetical protein